MPIYEYRCEKCGHEFEREQRISEDPIKKCPSCGASRAKRLISATSFVLKGGGWYSDLYSSASGKKKEGAEGASDSGAKESGAKDSGSKESTKKDAAGDKKKGGGDAKGSKATKSAA